MRTGRLVPGEGWFDNEYLGIDQGPILLMIENYRSGFVWKVMRDNPYIRKGLQRAGFTGGWLDASAAATGDGEAHAARGRKHIRHPAMRMARAIGRALLLLMLCILSACGSHANDSRTLDSGPSAAKARRWSSCCRISSANIPASASACSRFR